MSVLLTRKAVLQAAVEGAYNVAQAVGVNDGFLVENPMYTIKPNVLERKFVRKDLSQMPFIIGRKIASMEFTTELRGNGRANSGVAANAPLIARLFRACGYALAGWSAPNVIGPFDQGQPAIAVNWAVSSQEFASGVYTPTANFNAGDELIVDGETYAFKAAPAVIGDVELGVDLAHSLANVVAAMNGAVLAGAYFAGTAALPDSVASTDGVKLTVTAKNYGLAGNAIGTVYTPAATVEGAWAHATLTGGADPGATSDVVCYYLTVDTAGPSGTAKITVTSETQGEGNASSLVTSGQPFVVGTKGLTITPTWQGNLAQGQAWTVWLMPPGISLQPISDNFESLTLVMHKDGVLHTMPGSLGTFEVTAQSGNYASVKWTFTGSFVEAVDDPNPAPIFERTLPSQVQLARLRIGEFPAIVEKMTFNQMNDVQIRPDVSAQDGYNGVRIVGRKPEGGINPEADLIANNDFWGEFAAAECMPFQMRVGTAAGNTVWMLCPNTQYSGMTYGDRNGILTYDAGMRFARSLGDDEAYFYFC
jgi:hypothetical protein